MGFSRGVDTAVIQRALDLVLGHRRLPAPHIGRTDAQKIDIALRAWLLRRHLDEKESKDAAFKEWLKDSGALSRLLNPNQFVS